MAHSLAPLVPVILRKQSKLHTEDLNGSAQAEAKPTLFVVQTLLQSTHYKAQNVFSN